MHSDILEIMGVGTKLSSEPRYGVGPDDIALWVDVTSRHEFLFFDRCDLTRKFSNLMHPGEYHLRIRNSSPSKSLVITVCVTSFISKGLVSSISFRDIFLAQTSFVGV